MVEGSESLSAGLSSYEHGLRTLKIPSCTRGVIELLTSTLGHWLSGHSSPLAERVPQWCASKDHHYELIPSSTDLSHMNGLGIVVTRYGTPAPDEQLALREGSVKPNFYLLSTVTLPSTCVSDSSRNC